MSATATRVAPWEDFVLRVIAIWKLLHATFFTAFGIELLRLRHHNVDDFLNRAINFLNSLHIFHINPESHFVDWLLNHAHHYAPWMSLAGYASFVYASLFAFEGIGLYLRKRWAEWLVVGATGSFLPFEIWALYAHFMWWKILLLMGNLLIVSYLVHRILLDVRLITDEGGPGIPTSMDKRPGPPSGSNGSQRATGDHAVSTKTR